MPKINVAIVGVGNCANSLIQGLQFYKNVPDDEKVPGLMHTVVGDYRISDIEIVAAFDVNTHKVGKRLGTAMWAHPNHTIQFEKISPDFGPTVKMGHVHDGIGKYLSDVIEISDEEPANVAATLIENEVDVLINYLPVGSQQAVEFYMEQALEAGVAVINCMPVFIARNDAWAQKFTDAGVPIIGDDIKSQVGATIVHRVLAQLFDDRGVHLDRTMQLNVGGNSDFLNMLERERLASKKESKTNAVTSIAGVEFNPGDIHVGPSDHVPWLTDRKWAYIRLEGSGFGGVPLNAELKLEVWDSPNSAGVVIDAVRIAAIALDRKHAGPVIAPSAYLMKSPPLQLRDSNARWYTDRFISTGNDYFADGIRS